MRQALNFYLTRQHEVHLSFSLSAAEKKTPSRMSLRMFFSSRSVLKLDCCKTAASSMSRVRSAWDETSPSFWSSSLDIDANLDLMILEKLLCCIWWLVTLWEELVRRPKVCKPSSFSPGQLQAALLLYWQFWLGAYLPRTSFFWPGPSSSSLGSFHLCNCRRLLWPLKHNEPVKYIFWRKGMFPKSCREMGIRMTNANFEITCKRH